MPDVVVIGAGHNSLVTACYLARAGLEVEVVERDTVVGGAVSTVERFPGYRVDRGYRLSGLLQLGHAQPFRTKPLTAWRLRTHR